MESNDDGPLLHKSIKRNKFCLYIYTVAMKGQDFILQCRDYRIYIFKTRHSLLSRHVHIYKA
ncbi:hypothetical protein BC941DRAFT_430279 [Chlamydoabsidia padenii]|nr:hypothetical protein BC941DRAFT_430279 [Chlamydoabsidia padenii]